MCLLLGIRQPGIGQPHLVLAWGEYGAVKDLAVMTGAAGGVVLGFALRSDPPFSPTRPTLIGHGDFITYTLLISNTGTLTATQLVITNAVPLGASSVVSAWLPAPAQTNPLVWQMAALAPGETITLQHQLRVNDNVTVTAIVNMAVLRSNEIDVPITRTTVHPFGVTSAPQIVYFLPVTLR